MSEYILCKEFVSTPFFASGSLVAVIWSNTSEPHVELLSSNSESVLGITSESHLLESIHPDDSAVRTFSIKEMSNHNEQHFSPAPFRLKDDLGSYIWVDESITAIKDEAGTVTHFLSYISKHVDRDKSLITEENPLFNIPSVGVTLNSLDGTFIKTNQQLLDMLGYTEDELMQLSYWDLTPKEYEVQEQEQLKSLNNSGKYGPYEKEYIHKKGYRINVLLNGVVVANNGEEQIWSTVQDVSHIKKSEKVLKKAQELGNIGHWYLDLVNNELSWSDETYRIFGLQPQEFEATYEAFVERIHPDDRDAVNSAYTHSLEVDEAYQIEHKVSRPDGEIRYVIERCEHFHGIDGSIIGSIGTVLDITDRKENENALIQARVKAEEANRVKSAFIESMSHEFRTPLNAILGFSNKMKADENLTSVQKKHLGTINHSGSHLLGLINEILDMSKIEHGQMRLECKDFDLYNIFNDISNLMNLQTEEKGLICIKNIDPSVPRFIHSDEAKMIQVLLNIIGNAIKFTEKGTVSLNIYASPVTKEAHKKQLHIEVSDTGCGINEDMLDEVFKPFIQDTNEYKTEQGTGLGLSISKKIVELLQGTIHVESKLGQGSTFYVILPIEISDKPQTGNIAPDELSRSLQSSNKEESSVLNDVVKEEIKLLPQDVVAALIDAAYKGSGLKLKKELAKIESFSHAFSYLDKLRDNYEYETIMASLKAGNV